MISPLKYNLYVGRDHIQFCPSAHHYLSWAVFWKPSGNGCCKHAWMVAISANITLLKDCIVVLDFFQNTSFIKFHSRMKFMGKEKLECEISYHEQTEEGIYCQKLCIWLNPRNKEGCDMFSFIFVWKAEILLLNLSLFKSINSMI